MEGGDLEKRGWLRKGEGDLEKKGTVEGGGWPGKEWGWLWKGGDLEKSGGGCGGG